MEDKIFRITALCCSILTVHCQGGEPPNVVILFADDAGYADFGFQESAREDFKHLTPHIDSIRVIQDNGAPTKETGYVTDRLGDAACNFIEENKTKPFYLFVSFTAPPGGKDSTSNYPLRGHKGELLEGGIRVPWAMAWPGVIEPGTVISTPVITLDILPTIFEAAGKPIDANWELDGTSLLPLFGASNNEFPERTLYWRRHGIEGPIALRDGDWKLLARNTPKNKFELYNLASDIGENNNVASEYPKILKRLQVKMDDWEAQLVTPLWGPGSPNYSAKSRK